MARTNKKERVFSAHEVANICGVVNQTAINWIDKGHLEAYTTPGGQYRVYADILAKFLQKQGMRLPDELKQILAEQARIEQVLIVDDDNDFNDLVKQFLDKRYPDYKVNQAFDGYDAGKAISEFKPDVVLLDINLPGVDGFKLCRQIKSDDNLSRPIVVTITGMADDGTRERALEAGADAFLQKPIDVESLPALIEELAENRATRRA
ncbi:DNA binding domain-containing protein, excisionase family [Alkalispirochaeta americana]|uniref:DNA binding domain-containing protein, excisionase family n=1 Tax=Alkalispirochaeta americana TaxID=159291 RepID=A0A1N6N440_9SPIO|nr:response regulator [Alkalispirochaeta americana]SIP86850.1 DNA binding domain-containing protein, excisionase family [Alkalispirochaeta americana]